MSPCEQVEREWEVNPRDHPLAWYEAVYKRHGFLFVTPAVYLMGRPVMRYAAVDLILDAEHVFDFEQCDTWFVEALAGDIKQAWAFLPWELPWMCFERGRVAHPNLRFRETRRMLRAFGVGLTA